jgi:hypothetical protein
MTASLTITRETGHHITTRWTAQQAARWAADGRTAYCPTTQAPARVGDIMSRTPAVLLRAIGPDGEVLGTRRCRRQPGAERVATSALVADVLGSREDLTFGGWHPHQPLTTPDPVGA